jgi:nicotinamide-nucleotide amidase
MIAEILSTGDEIRSGALVDSNSAYIAQMVESAGGEVVRHSSVGDDRAKVTQILQEIGRRSDFAVVTGGLGPTADDITAVAAAEAAGVNLVLDQRALASLEYFFEKLKRPLTESNKKQAMLPDGAECLHNPVGTAPGFHLKIGQCEFFFLPGVPYEMKQMLADQVIPRILKLGGSAISVRRVKTLSTFGLTESATGEQLEGFESRFPDIKLGFQTIFPEIHVKLYAGGSDDKALQGQLDAAARWIYGKLGNKILSDSGESLEKVVGNLLRKQNATLAVAESCTGGLVADTVTDVSGSSDYFIFGAVTYANESKMKILGVAEKTLRLHGAVAEETAKEMASGVRQVSGATYGLATSGIAGPGGATDDKPVGTICIGLATSDRVAARRFNFTFDSRRLNKRIFAATALELLRRELMDIGR